MGDEEDYENEGADAELEDEDDEVDEDGRRRSSSGHYQGHSAGRAGDESEDIGSQDEEDEEEEYENERRHGHESDEDEVSERVSLGQFANMLFVFGFLGWLYYRL